MRGGRIVLWASALALVIGLTATAATRAWALDEAEGYVQRFDNGTVNWSSGEVTAVGVGAPPSNAANVAQARALGLRAATVVARRNLLELLKGVQLDSATTVQNFMIADDTVQTRVKGALQNARTVTTTYMSDGSVEVTVAVSLQGLNDAMAARQPQRTQYLPPKITQPPPRPAIPDGAPTYAPTAQRAPQGPGYSGLLIDARGLGLKPAMSPRVFDQAGNETYGSSFVGREYAVQQGMVGYAKDMEKAAQNERVAGNPLVVKAVSVSGPAQTDIVISNEAAELIRQAARVNNFLEKSRVMVVLD